jgi:fatty-acyl-CoA synthase
MGMSLNFITDTIAGQLSPVAPDKPAVACGEEPTLSWAEFRETELRYAQALRSAGVAKGDRVALLLRNSADYVSMFLGCARAGAIAVRVNWRLTAREIQFALDDSETTTLIFDAAFADTLKTIRSDIPVERYVVRDDGNPLPDWAIPLATFGSQPSETAGLPEVGFDDPVSIMYTSGTTGTPKGAVCTHGNLLWVASLQAQKWKIDKTSVTHTAGPLFHAGGFEALLLPGLTSRGTIVISPSGGFTVANFMAAARKHGSANILLYPGMVSDLLTSADPRGLLPPSVGQILTGGDVVAPWMYVRLAEIFPGVRMDQSYGLTEGGAMNGCLDFEDARGHESSVGRAQAMSEIKVLREDGGLAGTDEIGEIHVRNGATSAGYWRRPDANIATFVDGWCATGDLGRVSPDGFLYIAGRAKDMIRSGGENVYPAEVEMIITEHEDVGDAAVIGVPDDTLVEVGAAIIVARGGRSVDLEALRVFLLKRLAKFKVPRYFEVVSELPRNPSGKVLKRALREQYRNIAAGSPG